MVAALPPPPARRARVISASRRSPSWLVPALFLLLPAGFAAGIWGSYREIFPARGLSRMTAVVESVSGDTMVLVRHEAVSGLMDPMSSMALFAESRELLDRADLHPGDRVRFTLRQLPDRLVTLEVQKIR